MTVEFGRVGPPWWDRSPVFIVMGGPSLTGRELGRLYARGTLLGVNDVIKHVQCDAVFSLDLRWHRGRQRELEAFSRCGGEAFVAVPEGYGNQGDEPLARGVTYLERRQGVGLSADPSAVVNGLHSGYGALNVAVLKKARDVYLLGLDLDEREPTPRWHGSYEWPEHQNRGYYRKWAARFDEVQLPPGCRVYNANPRSAVTAFPFTTYEALGL